MTALRYQGLMTCLDVPLLTVFSYKMIKILLHLSGFTLFYKNDILLFYTFIILFYFIIYSIKMCFSIPTYLLGS